MSVSSREPCAFSAPMAPSVSSGQSAKAIEAPFQISVQATLTRCGRPMPPNSAGAETPFQPASAHRL